MKSLLFHAIQSATPGQNWEDFLFDAATLALPEGAERLAPNVWLFPAEDRVYLDLARLGRQHGIATQCVVIVHKSEWQPLSPSG
jgi:hypothetical protein